jgi:hypothetical protein
LKVLYMSGYSSEMISRQGSLSSGSGLLQKPFTRAGLLNALRKALDSDSPAAEELAELEPPALLDPTV